MKRLTSLILALTLLFALSVPAAAAEDATGTTLRLEETDGAVTVKDASGKDKTAREGMRLYNGYTIATGASSAAYISLDDTKAVKLDSSGKVEIKKQGKKLEVSLTAGQLYFNVIEPLKTDESLNIRTATMVTGIRGSFGWVTPRQLGLMHGHVTLTCTNPETSETRVTEIYSGEKVSYEQAASQGADRELQEIDFVKEEIRLEDVPAIVVEQVAGDESLQAQLEEVETIDVTELVESLETKQVEEKAAETEAQAAVEEASVEQAQTIAAEAAAEGSSTGTATTYVDLSANAGSTGGGSTGGSSGGSSSSSTTTVADADTLSSALLSSSDVTFTGTGTASSLSIPSGKTLTVASGASLTLSGTSENLSSTTLINNGTLTISGTFNNGGATAGRFVNNGTLVISSGASFVNKANGTFSGSTSFTGGGSLKFTVSFDPNGGSEVAAAEYIPGSLIGTPTAPTKAEHTLAGWYTDSAFTTAWSFGADTMPGDNLTLYAKWTPNTYTVTLNKDGGSISETADVTGYTYGVGATLPTADEITKSGHTFGGWYEDATFSGSPVTSITATDTGDKTYFAKWTASSSSTGTTGTNVTWTLTPGDDGTSYALALAPTVSGTTATIDDFSSISDRPWASHSTDIAVISIDSGISAIGTMSFYGFTALESVTIPSGVGYIGPSAFADSSNLASVTINGNPTIGQVAFAGCAATLAVTCNGTLANWGTTTFYTGTFPSGVSISGTDTSDTAAISYTITLVSGMASYDSTNDTVTVAGVSYDSSTGSTDYSSYCTKSHMDAAVNNQTVELYLLTITGDTANVNKIINYAY